MGFGDEIMASGMARGAMKRGKKIAFGDGKKIVWGPWSERIFRHNFNIAKPGSEKDPNLEWIEHYKGKRLYNRPAPGRWLWNMDFRAQPGELVFDEAEKRFARTNGSTSILIEPNVPWRKTVAANKDWGLANYQDLADRLRHTGLSLMQFNHGRDRLTGVNQVSTGADFRHALLYLSRATLYIGPEGGLHHGAAALGIPAVVLFGGFIPPQVTGYDMHTNLTGGAEACGSFYPCQHCKKAMEAISVEEVYKAAIGKLNG